MIASRPSLQLPLKLAVLAALALVLAVHSVATIAFTLPATPLTVRYVSAIDRYIYPYFAQNWSFFAPTPPYQDDYVVTQYRVVDTSGRAALSPWVNLSRTFNEEVQRNRFSALEIVQLSISNAYGDMTRSSLFKHDHVDMAVYRRTADPAKQPPSMHSLERVAMAYFPRTGIAGRPVAVRIALFHHEFPRFNHRFERDDPAQHNTVLTFPFIPFEDVTPL
jgi:hypothetical protein